MSSWKIYQEANASNEDRPREPDKFGPLVEVVSMGPEQVSAYLAHLREDTGICHAAEAINV